MFLPFFLLGVLMSLIIVVQPRWCTYVIAMINFCVFCLLATYVAMSIASDIPQDTVMTTSLNWLLWYVFIIGVCLVLKYLCTVLYSLASDKDSWLGKFSRLCLDVYDYPFGGHVPALARRQGTESAITNNQLLDVRLLSREVYPIQLTGDITEAASQRVEEQLKLAINAPEPIIRIMIDSGGGQIIEAAKIRRVIQEANTFKTVELLATGACCSAALYVLTSLPVGQRSAMSFSIFMAHSAGGSEVGVGIVNEAMTEQLASETMIDSGSLEDLFASKKDFYFDAKKALELGVIGHIL